MLVSLLHKIDKKQEIVNSTQIKNLRARDRFPLFYVYISILPYLLPYPQKELKAYTYKNMIYFLLTKILKKITHKLSF